jgi:diguanylate cyclase (GGDEF)-like protein
MTRCFDRANLRAIFVVLLAFAFNVPCFAGEQPDLQGLLRKADEIKTSSYGEFTEIMQSLEDPDLRLSPAQQEYVRYLRGWQEAYVGRYESSIAALKSLIESSADPTLRFRARATMVNVMAIARRYEEAFEELNRMLEQLDQITDKAARDQGLGVAALLFGEAGQHELSSFYADKMIEENWNGRGICRGSQLKARALFENSRPHARPASLDQEIQRSIDACVAAGELTFANVIRGYQARVLMERGDPQAAFDLLQGHYAEVLQARYPRLMSQYDALLAEIAWERKDAAEARRYALRSIDNAVKNEITEPIVIAYRLLYTIAKERGDEKSALEYHEKYAAADKGYLDDVSVRQVAYERVRHELAANKLQIESLKLQRELDAKAIENVRLYIALLIVILAFIGFWAYKTKRSQLHFMKLSRRDGLTGIFNRPHFMELASSTLETCKVARQDVSLVLCDLDHFKEINDRYGHAEGDAVLKRMVNACQAHLRAADIFARVGGEEFCIMLPGCSIEDARERAENLRLAIANVTDKSRATISASMGVSSTTPSGYDLHQLMAHADTALYQAKRAGRDCVVVYDPNSIVTELRPGSASAAP